MSAQTIAWDAVLASLRLPNGSLMNDKSVEFAKWIVGDEVWENAVNPQPPRSPSIDLIVALWRKSGMSMRAFDKACGLYIGFTYNLVSGRRGKFVNTYHLSRIASTFQIPVASLLEAEPT